MRISDTLAKEVRDLRTTIDRTGKRMTVNKICQKTKLSHRKVTFILYERDNQRVRDLKGNKWKHGGEFIPVDFQTTSYMDTIYTLSQTQKSKSEIRSFTYPLSNKEFNVLFHKQDGKCKLCDKSLVNERKALEVRRNAAVDHNHTTFEVRGILCNACNYGLGCFKENIEILSRAIEYLQKPNQDIIEIKEAVTSSHD